jgi:guanylate kinase
MAKIARLVALSAPSGAGKSTICDVLLRRNPGYRLSISATSRPPRGNEKNGVEYYFLSRVEFLKKVENNEFLEHEEIHGNYYGTLKSTIEPLLEQEQVILFDVGVYGAMNLKKFYPANAITFFIHAPSLAELKKRLHARKTEDEAQIQKRLARLPEEYAQAAFFDYQLVNEERLETAKKIEKIVQHHHFGQD